MITIIEQVNVYAPEELGLRDILFCCGKIVEVGSNLGSFYPRAQRLTGAGLIAVPGYIDQHVHVIGGGGEGSFRTRVPELKLSDCIRAGVTTVVGVLGTDGITRRVENLLAKTKALNEEGITAYCLTGSYEYPTITLTGDLKKDIAFVTEILGVKVAISDHRCSHLSTRELIRLVSEVRLASLVGGKPGVVTFHLGRGKGGFGPLFELLEQTDLPIKHLRPTHVGEHFEDSVKFARLGGYLDFTAGPDPAETARQIAAVLQAGAPLERLTLSSDANGSFPQWNEKHEMIGITAASLDSLHGTVQALIRDERMGISEALSLVTGNVAAALEIDQTKGRLAPGYDADILLFDQNFRLDTVIGRGSVLMRDGEVRVKGTYEHK